MLPWLPVYSDIGVMQVSESELRTEARMIQDVRLSLLPIKCQPLGLIPITLVWGTEMAFGAERT